MSHHPLDALGVRDHDQENPQGPRLKRSQEPKETESKARRITVNSGRPFILSVMSGFTFHNRDKSNISTFVPSSRALFSFVDTVYESISRLNGFREVYQNISPYPKIRMYYAYAFYIRVLTIMETYNRLPPALSSYLQLLLEAYPLDKFIIAEPFVPFFEALCAFQPSDARFGVVLPALPPSPGATTATHGALSPELMLLLPNMVGIARSVTALTNPNPLAAPPAYCSDIEDPFGQVSVPSAHNAIGLNSWKKISIGCSPLSNVPYAMDRARLEYRTHNLESMPFPVHNAGPGIPDPSRVNSWQSYLMLDQPLNFFSNLLAAADVMNIPFTGNRTLADFAISDGPYSSVTFTYDNGGTPFASANASRAAATPILPLSGTAEIHEPHDLIASTVTGVKISKDQIALACLAQVNVRYPANYGPNSSAVGTFGQTRNGPYWDPINLKEYGYTHAVNPQTFTPQTIGNALLGRSLKHKPE